MRITAANVVIVERMEVRVVVMVCALWLTRGQLQIIIVLSLGWCFEHVVTHGVVLREGAVRPVLCLTAAGVGHEGGGTRWFQLPDLSVRGDESSLALVLRGM